MTKKPHQDTALAKFVEKRMLELRPTKSQAEIATEAGFVNPNMISMIKSGATKLSIDRVPSLAKALDSDPAYLLRLALDQAVGSTSTAALYEILGRPVTKNEHGWLEELRNVSDNSDPRVTTRSRAALRAIFGK